MRPDRIIVGETRGAEVLDMLQAMNTGHPGSMSTDPRQFSARCLCAHGGYDRHGALRFFRKKVRRALIASAINIIVQIARLPDGMRRVVSVSEVVGIEDGSVATQEIFFFSQEGVSPEGRIHGRFLAAKTPSVFVEHFRTHGANLPDAVFQLDEAIG